MTRATLTLIALGLACQTALAQSDKARDVTIRPYKGDPVFIDEGEAPPEPRVVSAREQVKEEYKSGAIRFDRTVAKFSDNSYVNNGDYKEFYESGGPFVEGQFDMGDHTGEWTYYHPNGSVAKKVTYVDGKPSGDVEVRRADGTLKATRKYDDGKRVGEWLHYDETGEERRREEHYSDGKPHGVWKVWADSGQLIRETEFKEGLKDGTAKEWYPDGTQRFTAEFKDGNRHGLTVIWDREGKKVEQQFNEGKRVTGE